MSSRKEGWHVTWWSKDKIPRVTTETSSLFASQTKASDLHRTLEIQNRHVWNLTLLSMEAVRDSAIHFNLQNERHECIRIFVQYSTLWQLVYACHLPSHWTYCQLSSMLATKEILSLPEKPEPLVWHWFLTEYDPSKAHIIYVFFFFHLGCSKHFSSFVCLVDHFFFKK